MSGKNEKNDHSTFIVISDEAKETIIDSLEIRLNRVEFINGTYTDSRGRLENVEDRVREALEEVRDERD